MGQPSNAQRFLNAYAAIEQEMKRLLKLKHHRRFFELIDKAARLNPVIDRYRFDLREYGELRNAIVHDRADGEIIAEPNDATTIRIEKIAALFLEPPTVAPLFLKEVLTLDTGNPVLRAIRELSRLSYTQAPIMAEGKIAGLLTSNMIVRWMGMSLAENTFDLDNTTLGDVLELVGAEDNFELVAVDTSLVDITDLFYRRQQEGRKLEAVLITRGGASAEPPLGIITKRDLPRVYRALEQNGEEA